MPATPTDDDWDNLIATFPEGHRGLAGQMVAVIRCQNEMLDRAAELIEPTYEAEREWHAAYRALNE